jgi:hypothetical protein
MRGIKTISHGGRGLASMAVLLLLAGAAGCGDDGPTAAGYVAKAREHIAEKDLRASVIELKNAADEDATVVDAFKQLQTYKVEIPDLFVYNEAMVAADGNTRMHTFFASALNDVFNLHTKRVVLGAYYRIPGFLWWALIVASCVAMVAVGFQFGISGRRRILTANVALALTFALVMILAFDLDRAGEGMIAVNQQPMIDLYQSMSDPD